MTQKSTTQRYSQKQLSAKDMISCTDINTLVDRAKVYPDLSAEDRQEVINLYYDFGEKYGLDCRDAKAD